MVNYGGRRYDEGTHLRAPEQLAEDSFALGGTWALDYQGATATDDDNAIALNYHARNVYLVVGGTGTVTVTRDGATTTIPVSGPPNMRQIVADDQDGPGTCRSRCPRGCRRSRSPTADAAKPQAARKVIASPFMQ